ncbi:luciferase family protein [Streptomyces inhibens]|uniref:luciferase domain-containing protein n=1 Tax=Streptomyces inhibens TaxID=2293571 RepID=UPI00379A8CE0
MRTTPYGTFPPSPPRPPDSGCEIPSPRRLVDWPALSRGRAGCGAQYCLCAGSWEIVHFHSGSEVDVHMTRHMIDRLGPALRGSSALKLPSASGWITVRLETLSDIDLLATLVSAALLATGSAPGLTEPDRTDRCSQWPRERPTRRPGRRARMAIRWLCKPLRERRRWQGRRVPSSRHGGARL